MSNISCLFAYRNTCRGSIGSRLAAALLISLIALGTQACSSSAATTPAPVPPVPPPPAGRAALTATTALYGRLVRLSRNADPTKNGGIVASVTTFNGPGAEDIYSSSDGSSFILAGTIKDPDFATGLCCGTLYELPAKVGGLEPGTLLWAGSVGQNATNRRMQIKIYQSADRGVTWSYLSNCATATSTGGLWEPQFAVANDGALVCFFSDEGHSGHSQILSRARSYDGLKWQDSTDTVASTIPADRPGMAVVTKLPGGIFFMSYELCGAAACAAYYRTSADGWAWGDATNTGTKIVTASGQYFKHAPTNAWAPVAGSANGQILLVGQVLSNADGTVAAGNGKTIFTNASVDGSGMWNAIGAPVQVPSAYDNYCPNYSSALLPSVDGTKVLEFADDYTNGVCTMYFATGPTN